MPELPEVETVRRGLEKIIGKKVGNIFRSDKKLRFE
jgi:formamidopyrimidine-DNA glycosylase